MSQTVTDDDRQELEGLNRYSGMYVDNIKTTKILYHNFDTGKKNKIMEN